jgi:hypothetical protein
MIWIISIIIIVRLTGISILTGFIIWCHQFRSVFQEKLFLLFLKLWQFLLLFLLAFVATNIIESIHIFFIFVVRIVDLCFAELLGDEFV